MVAIALLALPGAGKAVGEPVLIATVSDPLDSSAITITDSNGATLSQISPGTYDVEVRDNSSVHNFRLTGTGVSRSTTIGFEGTVMWQDLSFQAGSTYSYQCDAHADFMNGSFTTSGSGGPPPPPPPSPPPPPGPPPPGPPPPPPPGPPGPPPPPAGPPPPPPAASHHAHQSVSGFRVGVVRAGARRTLVVRAKVTQRAQAKLRLQRGSKTVVAAQRRFLPGPNVIRVQLRRTLPAGRYVVRLTIAGAPQAYTARIRLG